MPHTSEVLKKHRQEIDRIDNEILELLAERYRVVGEVVEVKIKNGLPIYIPKREQEMVEVFRNKALKLGLDQQFAEDLLRMMMNVSRKNQSDTGFPRSTEEVKTIAVIGGRGGMGKLYARNIEKTGNEVLVVDQDEDSWAQLELRKELIDLCIVTVPIHKTRDIIQKLGGILTERTVMVDFTSHKSDPVNAMHIYHKGPVIGMHPMHGPDSENLSKQLMVVCKGRRWEEGQWFINQCELWGMRLIYADANKHDHIMNLVQGLRHYVALLHGSFMKEYDIKPEEIVEYSSPIYRAELMMTGRIFAQSAELYADIVFSNDERRALLMNFFEHHRQLADHIRNNDKAAFINEFELISDYFGDFAPQAQEESSYLIGHLFDRFAI
jgi:chorismate mutase/prephenate dehydrogenase